MIIIAESPVLFTHKLLNRIPAALKATTDKYPSLFFALAVATTELFI